MAYRAAHGTGRLALARVETLPVDELPSGIPDPTGPEKPEDRTEKGHFTRGNRISAKGGKNKAGKVKLAYSVGHNTLQHDAAFAKYRRLANSFNKAQCKHLATTVGGGTIGPAASSMVASAAIQLAWSRYLTDQASVTGNEELALKGASLADKSRQALLTAHELCAREAMARGVHTNGYNGPPAVNIILSGGTKAVGDTLKPNPEGGGTSFPAEATTSYPPTFPGYQK